MFKADDQLRLASVELFSLGNLAFLAVDVYIAHSTNAFASSAEWIPVAFSIVAPAVLLLSIGIQRRICPVIQPASERRRHRLANLLGLTVGGGAIAVGISGLLWHLNSQFFVDATLESLVYTAPFVAPLAYTGVGLLIVLNRMVSADTDEWGSWVVILALGGFTGNFVLSLADHAQNGFFEWREWIPVASSAVAVASLFTVAFVDRSISSLKFAVCVMMVQIFVGMLGWYYHMRAIGMSHMDTLWDKIVYSAPLFAPLLFANLALLAVVGLWSFTHDQQDAMTHGS